LVIPKFDAKLTEGLGVNLFGLADGATVSASGSTLYPLGILTNGLIQECSPIWIEDAGPASTTWSLVIQEYCE
jgi:hypothetical protein